MSLSNKKYIVFKKNGRLGNALFRYFACSLFCMKYNFEFILEDDYNSLNKYNDYTFYKGVDQVNNDVNYFNNKSIDELKDICNKNCNYVGFNTLGFIKSDININELRSNEYINEHNNHGIYIKNKIIINDANFLDYIMMDDLYFFNGDIIMDMYYQFDDIYLNNKESILKFIEKNKSEHILKTDNNESYLLKDVYDNLVLDVNKIYDIVIHLRLDDFNNREDYIEYDYLINLFNTIDFSEKKIGIVVQKPNNITDLDILNRYLLWFKNKNYIIKVESNDTITDFNIMKQCKILICSNSTLSWSAAYLSKDIELCYFPNYCFYKIPRKVYFKKPIQNTILYDVNNNNHIKLKVVVLTLKDYNERKKNINELFIIFKQLGINIELFYGVNGKNINKQVIDDETIKLVYEDNQSIFYNTKSRSNGQIMSCGELGCAWSHLCIYKQLIDDKDFDKYLILEDDALLTSDFESLINILNNIPNQSDVCHIGESTWYPFKITNKMNDFFYEYERKYFNHTTSYIITKNGANKLLKFTKDMILVPADDLLSNAKLYSNDFNLYVPEQYLFKQKGINSIIKNMG
uniref:Glycosyl transferase family 25 domain-containing protein n=1 Tax=viral metagenome TaxID=1070528 RepID=A0A6C0EFK9_9ZZZZ